MGEFDEWEPDSMIGDISKKILHELGQMGWEMVKEKNFHPEVDTIKKITFKREYVDEIIDKQHIIDLVVENQKKKKGHMVG